MKSNPISLFNPQLKEFIILLHIVDKEYTKQLPKFINNLESNISLIKKETNKMSKISNDWKLSLRDDERHQLDWSKNHPEKLQEEKEELKQKIIKMHKELGDNINLKEKYPYLF